MEHGVTDWTIFRAPSSPQGCRTSTLTRRRCFRAICAIWWVAPDSKLPVKPAPSMSAMQQSFDLLQ